ncbi:hypothetical protein IAQ61_001242 [Plenodomus lingam]|uniref:Predicted protein n=1 Tax=Leptosphaeria maculans (strain JN3 / isolate v23.1.3 / race Av1-4-5-6-7-8) TaxID=985895 RepID=E5A2A8_LEPMJ|nr:predicted protein [Plenodomus lingam JN3]KAH9880948.1 hypothetical protein IAQ61_001242 [Plenodomus lingam]CBX97543.1 predicted protein [Plenodomus lingam JN3]
MQHYRLRIIPDDHITIHDLVGLAVASSGSGSGAYPVDLRFDIDAGCVATMVPRVRLAGLKCGWGCECACGSERGDTGMGNWDEEYEYKEDANDERDCEYNHHTINTNNEFTRGDNPFTIPMRLGLLVLLFLLLIPSTMHGIGSVVLGRVSEARDMQMRGFVGGGAVVGDFAGKRGGAWRGGRVEWKSSLDGGDGAEEGG